MVGQMDKVLQILNNAMTVKNSIVLNKDADVAAMLTSVFVSSYHGCLPKEKISHRTTPKLHTSDSIVNVR